MKKTPVFFSVIFLFCVLFSSCSSNPYTVDDEEETWQPDVLNETMVATDENGDVAFWSPIIQTIIGNSVRGVSFTIHTCEPGMYSGSFDTENQKWSTDAISYLRMTIDYDGKMYPEWYGKWAVLTIHKYNKSSKKINATLDAILIKTGTTEMRKIKVEMKNLILKTK